MFTNCALGGRFDQKASIEERIWRKAQMKIHLCFNCVEFLKQSFTSCCRPIWGPVFATPKRGSGASRNGGKYSNRFGKGQNW